MVEGGPCMNTSIVWVALTGLTPQVEASPTWKDDYFQARREGEAQRKPLAVFLAPGEGGYRKLAADGSLSGEARRVLAERYVCVHVDTSTERGRKLAQDFEMSGGVG